MAAVLGEGDGWESVGEAVEEAAGVDGVELAGIADHDDLRARIVCGVEEGGEAAGGCHRGFVDHDARFCGSSWRVPLASWRVRSAMVSERDTGLGLELPRRRWRRARRR